MKPLWCLKSTDSLDDQIRNKTRTQCQLEHFLTRLYPLILLFIKAHLIRILECFSFSWHCKIVLVVVFILWHFFYFLNKWCRDLEDCSLGLCEIQCIFSQGDFWEGTDSIHINLFDDIVEPLCESTEQLRSVFWKCTCIQEAASLELS